MDNFEINQDYALLPPIAVGDLVHLNSAAGLGYLLKCVVEELSEDSLVAKPTVAYTTDGSSITSGHGTELIGTSLLISKQAVHQVVKAPGGQV